MIVDNCNGSQTITEFQVLRSAFIWKHATAIVSIVCDHRKPSQKTKFYSLQSSAIACNHCDHMETQLQSIAIEICPIILICDPIVKVFYFLQDLVPSTINRGIAGQKFYPRDRGVLTYHMDPYLTTTQKDHRAFTK